MDIKKLRDMDNDAIDIYLSFITEWTDISKSLRDEYIDRVITARDDSTRVKKIRDRQYQFNDIIVDRYNKQWFKYYSLDGIYRLFIPMTLLYSENEWIRIMDCSITVVPLK